MKETPMTTVHFEKDGAVAVVTMAKPPHNLIEDGLIRDLQNAYRSAVEEGCRSILLRSAMRHFCAGADVAGFAGGGRRRDQAGLEALLDSLGNVPLPPVGAVAGRAPGCGFQPGRAFPTICRAR